MIITGNHNNQPLGSTEDESKILLRVMLNLFGWTIAPESAILEIVRIRKVGQLATKSTNRHWDDLWNTECSSTFKYYLHTLQYNFNIL